MHSALIELVARPQAERLSRWMIKLASRTQGVVVRAASEFGDLTLSGPAWERVTVPISIQRFDTLLSHLPSQQASRHGRGRRPYTSAEVSRRRADAQIRSPEKRDLFPSNQRLESNGCGTSFLGTWHLARVTCAADLARLHASQESQPASHNLIRFL